MSREYEISLNYSLLNIYKVRHLSLKNALPVFVPFGSSEDRTKNTLINLRKQAWLLLVWTHVGHTLFFPLNHLRKNDVNEPCSKTTE